MDIEEFVKKNAPGRRTSRLDKYANEIKVLKTQKYTDEQIRQWLATNGVEISREVLRRYCKRLAAKSSEPTIEKPLTIEKDEPVKTPETDSSNESHTEKLRRKLAEQQGDADKTRFKHDKSGNIK
jgi:hypothetical protein